MKSPILLIAFALTAIALPPGVSRAEGEAVATFPATPSKVELQDGDVFVFLGDSITHQALYTQYVETFFLTRYPERDIRFHNAGVSGDRAADALRRFQRDVAHYQPDYVSVLLGMNDAEYTAWKPEVFETYVANMSTLLDRLKETGAGVSLMHPTMFDARAARQKGPVGEPTGSRYNGVLAYFGEWCRETAWQRGLGFADLHAPLNRITFDERRKDPLFTLIPDAVHPGPNGQLVMAVTMLEELFSRGRLVSNVTITRDQDGKPAVTAPGANVSAVETGDDGSLLFEFQAASLPWVVPDEARLGYELTRAGHRLSGERFASQDLAPGEWELLIDGTSVGTWPHTRLARGVELQGNDLTPQYQQASAIAHANAKRNSQHVKALRDWWLQRKIRDFEIRKLKAEGAATSQQIAEIESAHEAWLSDAFTPGIKKAEADATEEWKKLREMAQPKSHRYELRPMKD